jgi:hypothetical protein
MKATEPRPEHAPLIAEIEAFLIETEVSASAFSALAMGDPTFVKGVREGRRMFFDTEFKVRTYISYVRGGGVPAEWLAAWKNKETPRSAPPSHPRRRQSPA